MLTVEQALRAVLDKANLLPPRPERLSAARGCSLAEDVAADIDLPPFDKALVDGYAVRSQDLAGKPPYRLSVVEEITAGHVPSRSVEQGETVSIMTGAPVPVGADAVVMHEQTERADGGQVIVLSEVAAGQNRLSRGREFHAGEVVLHRGERLHAAHLGVLASVGREHVQVIPQPRLVIVPTGDELVKRSEKPGPGQIRETNSIVLAALANLSGAVAHEARVIAPDEPEELRAVLASAMYDDSMVGEADILVICGGVSAGKKDLVPAALASLGVEQVFHKVRLKPGKPLWFGVGPERGDGSGLREPRPGALVFGLPGNPVSSLVCFLLFVRPAIAALRGEPARAALTLPGRLIEPFVHRGDRPTYHPARWHETGFEIPEVEPLDWAGSADLRAVARADGFAVFPAGDHAFDAGEIVNFLPLP